MVTSLHARINAMKKAVTIHDIIMMPQFHFHKLYNKAGKNYEGTYAIDVKSRDDQWRVIVEPLDEDEKPFDSCHIDELSRIIKVVKIREVSKHYE